MGGLCNQLGNTPSLGDVFVYLTCLLTKTIVPLIFALALVMFLWGVVQFVIGDSEEAKTKGRQVMVWGIVGLVVMTTVWGLVAIVGRTLNLNSNFIPQLPQQQN